MRGARKQSSGLFAAPNARSASEGPAGRIGKGPADPSPGERPKRGRGAERRLIASGSDFEARIGYSRAVVDGGWIFVSGTTGFDYAAMSIAPDAAAQALANIASAMAEAGFALADVVRVRYILPDAADFAACEPVLRDAFGDIRPAATMMVAGLLDPRMRIEIEVTGRRRSPGAGG